MSPRTGMPITHNIVTSNYEVIGEAKWQTLDSNETENEVFVYGYQFSKLRAVLFHTLCILSCGIPYFAMAYCPMLHRCKYINVSLRHATAVGITDKKRQFQIENVKEMELNLSSHRESKLRYFMHQHNRHIWHAEQGVYIHVLTLNKKITINVLMDNLHGINKRQQNELIKLYGPNSVVVAVKSYWKLFVEEVFNPFYLFQVFSIILWSLDEYYQYATCVLILSALSCISALYQTKQMSRRIHNMAGQTSSFMVTVLRPTRNSREECVVNASRLVPGDVLVLPSNGCVMPCDAMLLTGSCIVNESMLTGESVPVMKGPPCPSGETYSTETHKRHTLFAGTHVIQTRFYGNNQVLAKVVRTGFSTAKGELIRSILYPSAASFKFYTDAVKFLMFMFLIAACGMGYSIYLFVERGSSLSSIVLRTLDIITIVVPPALPAAMTAGIVQSQKRLKVLKIFCVSPPRIIVAGKLQIMCFDKTGTLTEDGLDFYGVIPSERGVKFGERVDNVTALTSTSPLVQALASCHSLTSIQGELKGDPLDLKMFEFTQWVLDEPGPENTRYDNLAPAIVKPATTNEEAQNLENYDPFTMEVPYEIGLLRRFHFSSSQQCMGVIARVLGQPQMVYFVKGAPEKVADMCNKETLPENFNSVLNEYTWNGFRVISLAYKKLARKMKWVDAQRVHREALECDMVFLGFLVMQNSLKPETTQVIKDLHDANIRQVMVTGDNIMTAMSVARGCSMVKPHQKIVLVTVGDGSNDAKPPIHMKAVGESGPILGSDYVYAMEGRTWSIMKAKYPDTLNSLIDKGMPLPYMLCFGLKGIVASEITGTRGLTPLCLKLKDAMSCSVGVVYGRFGPDQKTQLITALQNQDDTVVGMCGDGANDCGALKAAHVGISLSEADASVAAPFTSQLQNILCVKRLVMEGRCALSTSFAIFKYMALYSLIQFISILILYKFYSILGNNQFLYIDLVLTTLLALSLGRARPGPRLTAHSPPVSLVSLGSIAPLTLQVLAVLMLQMLAVALLKQQEWFKEVEGGPDVEVIMCWENTVIFIISAFQYLNMAGVYARGWPFRQPFFYNYAMVATLLSQAAFIILQLMCPWQWLGDYMEIETLDRNDHSKILFRVYMMIIPAVHLVLALAIEAMFSDAQKCSLFYKYLTRSCAKKQQQADEDDALLRPPPVPIIPLC